MQISLMPRLKTPGRDVRIRIPAKQKHLKDEHAGRPNRRAAAKPGQDKFPDQRLNLEQQERAEKDGRRVGCCESSSEVAPRHSECPVATPSGP